jgi:Fur family ferric uptake transcriptional regulator
MIASTQSNDSLANVKAAAVTSPLDLACAKLKAGGLRVTRPRRAILTALLGRTEPSSIEQIHAELGAGRCDLVTVYRCIAAFAAIRLVRRAFFLNGTCLYEIDLGETTRYHVVCPRTRQMDEIDRETAGELGRALRLVEAALQARGYRDVGHILEFIGSRS